MQEFINFLVDNWQVLVSLLLALISLIIALVRKKPTASSLTHYIESVCHALPFFINQAEKTGLTGSRKFCDVLGKAMHVLHDLVSCSEQDDAFAKKIFTEQIEAILSTPTKKGDK